MKSYNRLIFCSVILYLLVAFGLGSFLFHSENQKNHAYRVEANRILSTLTDTQSIENIKLDAYETIWKVEFLDKDINNQEVVKNFFQEDNTNKPIFSQFISIIISQAILNLYIKYLF